MIRASEYAAKLPLPLAQLLVRTLKGKSAEERHNCAFYLCEAALKLAASGRVGALLQALPGADPETATELSSLLLPSMGDWLAILRYADGRLAKEAPEGPWSVGSLEAPRPEWTATAEFYARAVEQSAVRNEVASEARRTGLAGLFKFLVAYRNRVLAHGSQPKPEFFHAMGPLLLAAALEAVSDPSLLAAHVLVKAEAADGDGRRFLALSGLAGIPAEGIDVSAAGVAGHLYLVSGARLSPLHPLVVYQAAEGNERVSFLNKTVARISRSKGEERIRRVEYLDYASSEQVEGGDTRGAVESLLDRVRGRSMSEEERSAVDEHTASESVAEGESCVEPGKLIGDFVVESELGRGAMGVVYQARQLSTRRRVALKVLNPALATDELAAGRFRREVRALGKSDHANVVRILTSGRDQDHLYYAMEFVEGVDLARLAPLLNGWRSQSGGVLSGSHIEAALTKVSREVPHGAKGSGVQAVEVGLANQRNGEPGNPGSSDVAGAQPEPSPIPALPAPASRTDYYKALARLFAGAARGLAQLHERGIVHRDVKPGNLMLTDDADSLIVMDLGLAQVNDASLELSRNQASLLGTLRYMAPEQLQRHLLGRVDCRADVYGLGASLYEFATGRPFLDAKEEKQLIVQVLNQPPVPPKRADPMMPRMLADIIEVSTAKLPTDRYQDASAMADDLEAFASDRPIRVRPPGVVKCALLACRRHPARLAAVAVSGTVLVAIGALLALILNAPVRQEAPPPSATEVTAAVPAGPVVEVSLCANQAERFGAFECVGPVTEDLQERRAYTLRFTTVDGKTRLVERLNGAGALSEDELGVAVWKHEYDQSGRLITLEEYDKNVQIVHQDASADTVLQNGRKDNMVRELKFDWRSGVECRLRYLDKYGKPLKLYKKDRLTGETEDDGEDVFSELRVYDTAGLLDHKKYLSASGFDEPRLNKEGAFGVKYEYKAGHALPCLFQYIDRAGHAGTNRNGVGRTELVYDEQGNVTEERLLDSHGTPVLGAGAYSILRRVFDPAGNQIEGALFGTEDRPILGKDGFARATWKYDGRGNGLEAAYFGLNGGPVVGLAGCSVMTQTYDSSGNPTETSCFGLDGAPSSNRDGCATVARIHDERGNVTVQTCVGSGGKLVLGNQGFAREVFNYDERGNRTEASFFGTDGKPVICKEGYARLVAAYDDRANQTEAVFFGVDGRRTVNKRGFARLTMQFDNRGNRTRAEFFGTEDEPILTKDGIAGTTSTYDDKGNWIESSYFGKDAELALNKDGFAKILLKYDEQGNQIEQSYLGADGKPILNNQGYAMVKSNYNERGNRIRQDYFGKDGEPILNSNGVALVTSKYDERGNPIQQGYFGRDGNPILSKAGIARVEWKYDGRGNKTEEAAFGTDQMPILSNAGYARLVWKYDERGNKIEAACFGTDGKPVFSKTGPSVVKWKYDERGNEVELAQLGTDGKPVADQDGCVRRVRKYDDSRNATEDACIGTDGKAMLNKKGLARAVLKYDDRGNQILVQYFGKDSKPIMASDGFAQAAMKYDDRGNQIEYSYFGIDGKPILSNTGVARVAIKYDDRGNQTEQACFGIDGRPVLGIDGCALVTMKYDDRGNQIEQACIGIDGKRLLSSGGFARRTVAYDDRGNQVESAFYGTDGEPTSANEGFARAAMTYDQRGSKTGESYFGPDGKRVLAHKGYARVGWRYDDRGNTIEEAYFGPDEKPVLGHNRFARIEWKYDDRGNKVEEAYFGLDAKPVLANGGIASIKWKYDDRGNRLEAAFFGTDGQPALGGEGAARAKWTYDEQGNRTEKALFGVNGEPVVGKEGYARVAYRYNERGRVLETAFFGTDGRACAVGGNTARGIVEYDDRGEVVRVRRFDVEGKEL